MNVMPPPLTVWLPRASALLSAVAVAASASAWVLLRPQPAPAPAPVVLPAAATLDRARLATLLGASGGAAPTAAPVAAGLRLQGILASGRTGQGLALIAVGGAVAKPVRAGQALDGGYTLEAVHPQAVELRDAAGATLRLDLPLPAHAVPGAPPASAPGAAASTPPPTQTAPVAGSGLPVSRQN